MRPAPTTIVPLARFCGWRCCNSNTPAEPTDAVIAPALREGNASVYRFRQIARPLSMRRKLSRVQSSHFRPLLDDGIDRLRIERPFRNGALFPDPKKLASLAAFCDRHPDFQRLHRPPGQIDGIVLLDSRGFRPPKMNCTRGEGRTAWHLDRRLDGQLLHTKPDDFAAPAAARGRGDHQDCLVA
ncbi:Hypothetical protein AT6N2_L1162 [Agrobacterium tumefaciens]|nr:Hypothetical protein AT6N2_L1162 [Agrobacterium tumefaciens]